MKCEICGNKAEWICPRCYRYVCKNCVDLNVMLCLDCSHFKREQEDDYVRMVNSIAKKLDYMKSAIDRCLHCPLLKDEVLRSLRIVKELENTAKLEGFERLHDEILKIKDKLQNIAVEFLVKLKFSQP